MINNILHEGSELEPIIELERFIYDQGEVYCVADTCEGCPYESSCESVEATGNDNLESTLNKSTRNNLKFGKVEGVGDFISLEPSTIDMLNSLELVNGVYTSLNPKKLSRAVKRKIYLKSSSDIIYKYISFIPKKEEDFLIYSEEQEETYCVRDCVGCGYLKICTPTVSKKVSDKVFVAIDSSSQEPQIITYLTEEPRYMDIFTNKSLLDTPYLLDPLTWVLEDVLKLSLDSIKVKKFIDFIGFEDRTLLYVWATTIYSLVLTADKDDVKLLEVVGDIDKAYKNFNK